MQSVEFQNDLAALLKKHHVDQNTKVKQFFAKEITRLEEIKEEMKDLSDSVKETLSYNDMTLDNVLDEVQEYTSLKIEQDSIRRKMQRIEEYISFENSNT